MDFCVLDPLDFSESNSYKGQRRRVPVAEGVTQDFPASLCTDMNEHTAVPAQLNMAQKVLSPVNFSVSVLCREVSPGQQSADYTVGQVSGSLFQKNSAASGSLSALFSTAAASTALLFKPAPLVSAAHNQPVCDCVFDHQSKLNL